MGKYKPDRQNSECFGMCGKPFGDPDWLSVYLLYYGRPAFMYDTGFIGSEGAGGDAAAKNAETESEKGIGRALEPAYSGHRHFHKEESENHAETACQCGSCLSLLSDHDVSAGTSCKLRLA